MTPDNPYAATEIDHATASHIPLTVGGTLRVAVEILTERFAGICMIVAGFWLPVELISSYTTYQITDEERSTVPLLLDQVSELLVGTFVTGAVIHIAYATLTKQPLSLGGALFQSLKTWPLLIANRILYGLIITMGFLLLIVPGFYLMIRLTMVDVVTAIERQAGTESISRSFQLTKEHFTFAFSMSCFFFLCSSIFVVVALGPQIFFPEVDTWYLDAMTSTLYDFLAAFFQICSVVMWNDMRQQSKAMPLQLPVPMQ